MTIDALEVTARSRGASANSVVWRAGGSGALGSACAVAPAGIEAGQLPHSFFAAHDAASGGIPAINAAARVVLLVDDDPGTLDVFRVVLEHAGFLVWASATAEAAIDLVREQTVDLVVVDLKLPDMSGLEVLRHVRRDGALKRVVLISAFLTIEICVEAMRLGAFDVLEKPIDADHLLAVVRACLEQPLDEERPPAESTAAIPFPRFDDHPGSAAHRWAAYVVKACEADDDLRTLQDWARWAGVSHSTLCEACRILGSQPHLARDFTRALRAMIKSAVYRCDPSVLLDVSDRRTLKVLIERAGPSFGAREGSSVMQFIERQRFIPTSNEGIRVLLGYFKYRQCMQDG
jgi:two-component system response regulator (stage 0 sporulation protein F)